MLARIAASDYAEDFVLKGGVLLAAFALRRPTKDIDLEATRIADDARDVASRIREIAAIALDDGIEFTLDSIRAETIRDGGEYQGVRVKLIGLIGRSENVIGLDVSFGDPIWPAPQKIDVPRSDPATRIENDVELRAPGHTPFRVAQRQTSGSSTPRTRPCR